MPGYDTFSFLSGYVLDDFPCLSEETISIKDQLELMKNWKLKPDFIINIKVNIYMLCLTIPDLLSWTVIIVYALTDLSSLVIPALIHISDLVIPVQDFQS